MKKKITLILVVCTVLFLMFDHFQNKLEIRVVSNDSKTIQSQREKHVQFLDNSPFKETLILSKDERKSIGFPPNKYYEEQWELTMNPNTGMLEPKC